MCLEEKGLFSMTDYTALLKRLELEGNNHGALSHQHQKTSGNNTLRPRQNDRHFPDDIFECIFLNENFY